MSSSSKDLETDEDQDSIHQLDPETCRLIYRIWVSEVLRLREKESDEDVVSP